MILKNLRISIILLSALAQYTIASGNEANKPAALTKALLGSLEDMTYVEAPEKLAPGIWKVTIGDLSQELRYTDHAAALPRIDALNEKVEAPFPFADNPISFYQSPDKRISVRIPAASDEAIYGFGLQLDGIKKTKKVLDLKIDHWGRGSGKTHAPVPFYISSKGYGVFFNTARYVKAHVLVGNRKDSPNLPPAVDRNPVDRENAPRWSPLPNSDAVEAHMVGNGLEVIIFAGDSLLDIVSRYNLYNGGGAMPPLWGLGFWYRPLASYNQAETEADIKTFAEEKFPIDVLGLEPGWMTKSYPCTFEWQTLRFPDPEAFSKGLLDQGIRLNLWVNPYISPEAQLYEPMYPLSGSHTVWLGIVPDYTLPEARQLLADQHQREHVDIGVSGYKIDEVDGYDHWLWPDHATFPSGVPAEAMRQSYGLLLQNATYNDLFKKHNTRTYGLVRASNGGASGYPYVIYSDSYNHEQYITALSAASLSGLLWTPEVRQGRNDRDWLNRFQTVCFSPLAMLNSWNSGRKPWGREAVNDDVRAVMDLRMRLLPYLYTAFSEYNRKGIPPIRAMILEDGFSEKPIVTKEAKLDDVKNPYAEVRTVQKTDQFMFGPSIMVAPFYNQHHSERTIQLPRGDWYDFHTGAFVGNDKTITVTAEQMENRLPLFVKDGALIPMLAESVLNTQDAYGKPLEVRHYGKKNGAFILYEDDGKTFDYEKGRFRLRELTMACGTGSEQVISEKGPAMFGSVVKWTAMSK
ncbi:MAG: TIM-barrel domain-containing protein [Opitutales bacterium]